MAPETPQKTISNFGALASVTTTIPDLRAERIFLVTGKDSFEACGAASVLLPQLKERTTLRFHDFEVNPKIEDAIRGATLARNFAPEVILAVGGGSVMDMAKLIKAFLKTPGDPAQIAQGQIAVADPQVPLIAVPTTAGSGSEATHFAVVYIGAQKFSLAAQCLLPSCAVLDGSLISSGTAYQKACNGLDALAQAIESSWACGATPESRATAFQAVHLAAMHLKRVVNGLATQVELQAMLEAANLAGQGINVSKTTAAHAWSYGITSTYGVPHGHAVWLTLPQIFQVHSTAPRSAILHPGGLDAHNTIMTHLGELLHITDLEHSAAALQYRLRDLGVTPNLSEIDADTPEQRKTLSVQVNLERLSNNPVRFDEHAIRRVFDLP